MYVLIKVDVDHDNDTVVSMQAASENLAEVQQFMKDEYEEEMRHPSVKWLYDGWDPEYCSLQDMHADCEIETCDWSVHWHIMDTNDMGWFSFI